MISISNKTVSFLSKSALIVLGIYSVGFFAYKTLIYYKIAAEKEKLEIVLQEKWAETNKLKEDLSTSKNKIETLEKQYITKEELEIKVKDIFNRMSLLDYQLNYLDAKKMCIDRHIIIAQVSAQSENGLKAAEGILSYIGKIKKHDTNDSIYFVDYISTPKEIK